MKAATENADKEKTYALIQRLQGEELQGGEHCASQPIHLFLVRENIPVKVHQSSYGSIAIWYRCERSYAAIGSSLPMMLNGHTFAYTHSHGVCYRCTRQRRGTRLTTNKNWLVPEPR